MKGSTQQFKFKRLVLITGLVFGMAACDDDSLAPPPSPPAENNAPVINSTAVETADEDQAYTYTFSATDADADTLTFASTTLPTWLTFDVATGVLSGTPAAADVGSHDVVLTVTDGEDTATESFTIVVTAAPDQVAPTFTSTGIVTGMVGSAYSYTATAEDENFDDLTFSAATVPAWAAFDADTAILSGTPDMAGDYDVELMVSDGTDAATQMFTIAVSAANVETVELTVFENAELPEWAAWTDDGGPTAIFTVPGDAERDQAMKFGPLTKPSVAGFIARAGGSSTAVNGVPFDASGIVSNGQISFELQLLADTTAPNNGWFFKVESGSGANAVEVLLSSSVEGHSAPALNTWQTYTFPLSSLSGGSLNFGGIDLFMVFPSYNEAAGAEYLVDNFKIVSVEGGGDGGGTGGTNLITNGDFENGLTAWKADVGSVVVEDGNSIFEAIVDTATTFVYDINQSNVFDITEGETYTFSFRAKASVARTIVAGLGLNGGDFTNISETVSLTTEWQTFTKDIEAVGIGGVGSRVLIDMGVEVGNVYIDDVSVEVKDVTPVIEPGAEELTNGDFEDGLTGWKADVGSVVVEDGNSVFEAIIDTATTFVYDINQSNVFDITEGETYTFSFRAKASVARTIVAGLGLNGGDFTNISETVSLTTEWQTFTKDIVAVGIGGVGSRVLIDMGVEVGNVYVDDVSVKLTDGSGGGDGGGDGGGEEPIMNTEMGFNFEPAGTVGTWTVFENGDNPALEIIANPDATGANTSATVAKFTALQAGQRFAGTETKSGPVFTLDASNSTIRIMVWKTEVSPVGIKLAVGAAAQPEIFVSNTQVNQWEELVFDFSGNIGAGATAGIDTFVVFPDFGAVGNERAQDNVIYFDNITFSAN
ncbi:MAG: hypothetical protein ACJAUM_002818 [Pseudomonadales bacterium]|jgi:hypothetical protein